MRAATTICALVLTFSAACGGGSSIEGDTSIDTAPDAPSDSPADTAADTPADTAIDAVDTVDDVPLPGAVTFEIGFVTDIPGYEYLFVQSGDYMGMVAWISVLDPSMTAVPLQPRCDICACDECTGCGVCGIADPFLTMAGSGSSTEWAWDGVTHPVSTCRLSPMGPDHDCQETGTLPAGPYTARFCWGSGPADSYPNDVIDSPVCADVAFDYPVPGGRVLHVVNYGG